MQVCLVCAQSITIFAEKHVPVEFTGSSLAGAYILIVMAAALGTYVSWRFWEGITAQVPLSKPPLICTEVLKDMPLAAFGTSARLVQSHP